MTREEIYKCFDEEDNDIKTARIYISMDIVRNMLKQRFALDQIQKSLPWLSKPDIFGYAEHEGKWLKYRIENKKENGYKENYEEGKAEVLDEVKKAFKTVKENHFTTVDQVVEAGFDRNIAETVISNL